MVARDVNGILIEVDDPKEQVMYKHFVHYGIYDPQLRDFTGEGNAQVICNFPMADMEDIEKIQANVPDIGEGKIARIRFFNLLAIKVNGTWRPV